MGVTTVVMLLCRGVRTLGGFAGPTCGCGVPLSRCVVVRLSQFIVVVYRSPSSSAKGIRTSRRCRVMGVHQQTRRGQRAVSGADMHDGICVATTACGARRGNCSYVCVALKSAAVREPHRFCDHRSSYVDSVCHCAALGTRV